MLGARIPTFPAPTEKQLSRLYYKNTETDRKLQNEIILALGRGMLDAT
jgi:hypothetical protein